MTWRTTSGPSVRGVAAGAEAVGRGGGRVEEGQRRRLSCSSRSRAEGWIGTHLRILCACPVPLVLDEALERGGRGAESLALGERRALVRAWMEGVRQSCRWRHVERQPCPAGGAVARERDGREEAVRSPPIRTTSTTARPPSAAPLGAGQGSPAARTIPLLPYAPEHTLQRERRALRIRAGRCSQSRSAATARSLGSTSSACVRSTLTWLERTRLRPATARGAPTSSPARELEQKPPRSLPAPLPPPAPALYLRP